jgi:hypothetical protein
MKKAGPPVEGHARQHRPVGSVDLVPNPFCGRQNAGIILTSKTWRQAPHLHDLEQVEDMHLIRGTLLVKPYERLLILTTLFIGMC